MERIFEEESKQETEETDKIQINRALNNATTFTTKVFENTKHAPRVYIKKSTY